MFCLLIIQPNSHFIKMVAPLVREERPVGLFKMLFLFGLLACFGGLLAQDITGLPISRGTGVMIFVGGLLFIMFRRRDSNNWNIYNASDALALHINGLGGQLLGDGKQKIQ